MSFKFLNAASKAEGLSCSQYAVLVSISSFAGADGTCYPSVATIARRCGLSKRTVIKRVEELVEAGLLTKRGRSNGKGQVSNLYTITLTTEEVSSGVVKEVHKGGDSGAPGVVNEIHGGGEAAAHELPIELPNINNPRTNGRSVQFDMFWNAYPKKKAKVEAEKAFHKLSPDDGLLSTILTDIKLRSESRDWANKQYIPNPATYIRGKRWEDEITEAGDNETYQQSYRTNTSRLTPAQRTRIKLQEHASLRNGNASALGDDARDIRPQVDESVWGGANGRLEHVIEGDYYRDDYTRS